MIAELREAVGMTHPFRDEELPWPELLRAQAEQPFDADPARSLLDHSDCPTEFRNAVLHSPASLGTSGSWMEQRLAAGALTVLDVAAAPCTPAPAAVRIITEHAARTPGFLHAPAARTLIRRVRTRRDHADAWVVAVRLLP
ncbi:hypothetical protein [Embleya sp. NPDC050493]|uniref:hypothetical protein n=1 Tax=Embleya sp. NPDC050493 TaxID=3363989 RepID=UPI0037AE5935